MKTITLTDEQFDNLFNYLDEKVNFIVDKSIDYQDSEILNRVGRFNWSLWHNRGV